MPSDRIWGATRAVLYLPTATETLTQLNRSRELKIREEATKFLEGPKTAFDKQSEDYVWQLKHRDTKTRGFATWCQNQTIDCELLVVQDIYQKSNEDDYWAYIDEYDDAGAKYAATFAEFSQGEFEDWLEDIQDRPGHSVVRSE